MNVSAPERQVDKSPARNGLAGAASPYLLQHATNPVNWHPWGPEALEKARSEGKPIFLSIGYSACHWCHVMAHESFEDEKTAKLLNRDFVCIKVDREERPDIDTVYMTAVQLMTGQGGWPLSVFLTPDLEPFYGGTYFPPEDRWGHPGFRRVLKHLAEAWHERRDEVRSGAESLSKAVKQSLGEAPRGGAWSASVLKAAETGLLEQFDQEWGGFGGAPKFPAAGVLDFLLRRYQESQDPQLLEVVVSTLNHMAAGGMYDHLGGGFHRYSVDREWRVPHFEKMLYDNALLAPVYLDVWRVTGHPRFERVARETLDYVLREMKDETGGFHAAEDADSEGQEGLYYLWSCEEIILHLGEAQGELLCGVYSVTKGGNFEGRNILMLADRSTDREQEIRELGGARRELLLARQRRIKPGRDDKVIAEWNGMMIVALAQGYEALGEERYLESAQAACRFILSSMVVDGRLQRAFREGKLSGGGYLPDYAQMIQACLALYECDFDPDWLRQARRLADQTVEQFASPEGNGFFFTAADETELMIRNRPVEDGSVPSGNSAIAAALLKLDGLTGQQRYRAAIESALNPAAALAKQHPRAVGHALAAAQESDRPPINLVLIGRAEAQAHKDMLAVARSKYIPGIRLVATGPDKSADNHPAGDLLQGKLAVNGATTAYLCIKGSCKKPMTNAGELDRVMSRLQTVATELEYSDSLDTGKEEQSR